jgi:hypothetical protein
MATGYGSRSMHRQRPPLSTRAPARAKPVAQAIERSAIVATYELHDRVLSNRSSRRAFALEPPKLDEAQRKVLAALDEDGYARVAFAELVGEETANAVRAQGDAFIADTERALGAADETLRRRPGKEFLVRAHSFDGVRIALDHEWFRACVSPAILDVANAYLRMRSKLSYVDLWYTVPQPAETKRVASQLWHYDFDDKHLLKAFLYLGDVDGSTGPFEYVAGSQPGGRYHDVRPWKPMGYGRVPEEDVARNVPADAIRTFTAPRGTLIFCNTSGLHRGGFATGRARVLATATYCSPASLAALSERNYEVDPAAQPQFDSTSRFAAT